MRDFVERNFEATFLILLVGFFVLVFVGVGLGIHFDRQDKLECVRTGHTIKECIHLFR